MVFGSLSSSRPKQSLVQAIVTLLGIGKLRVTAMVHCNKDVMGLLARALLWATRHHRVWDTARTQPGLAVAAPTNRDTPQSCAVSPGLLNRAVLTRMTLRSGSGAMHWWRPHCRSLHVQFTKRPSIVRALVSIISGVRHEPQPRAWTLGARDSEPPSWTALTRPKRRRSHWMDGATSRLNAWAIDDGPQFYAPSVCDRCVKRERIRRIRGNTYQRVQSVQRLSPTTSPSPDVMLL
jgi:hypothetical protein